MKNNLDLSIIILELGVNAFEASCKNVSVKIIDDKMKRFEIADDGLGIDKSIIDKVCLPSISTKLNHLGNGLSKIKNYCEKNQGYLQVFSEINIGTVVKGQVNCELGNLTSTIICLILNDIESDVVIDYQRNNKNFYLSTKDLKKKLNINSLTEPSIVKKIMKMIDDGLNSIKD